MEKRELFMAAVPVGEDSQPLIRKLLIANRGEIACRIIKTCQLLGVATVAVFTEPDRHSLHVEWADEAICLGPIQQIDGNPHLNIGLLIKTAQDVGADSIHPGYGYLSENSLFAKQVIANGLIFIGPTPNAISILGDKRTAKQFLLSRAPSIPLIPGYNGSEQDVRTLTREAELIGFPIIIKASSGGGGRGMRIVYDKHKLADELATAQSEAKKSFGFSDCILEKYIEKGKHIEIQIFGDREGMVISLFDRECSIQRRYQKVIEESPSPWLTPSLRRDLSMVACKIGKLLEYEGAGTVEFIVDVTTKSFYFLEVNARIQVEHPITEEVTGIDVVALQLYVAGGGKLSSLPDIENIRQVGHAIECRLCAEDPQRGFIPDLGQIWRWSPATESLPVGQTSHVRFETALRTFSDVSIYFDSMIAKVVVWAPTRALAIRKMLLMLANTICIGVRTNQSFLQSCLKHEEFRNPEYSTNFIPDHLHDLLKTPYIRDLATFQDSMSFIPSLLLRQINLDFNNASPKRPFSSIKRGFRNQPAGPSSVQADIVSIKGAVEPYPESFVLIPFERTGSTSSFLYSIQSLSKVGRVGSKQGDEPIKRPGSQLAIQFNTLLQKHRDASHPMEIVKIHQFQGSRVSQPGRGEWITADITMEVKGRRLQAFLSSDARYSSRDSGAAQRVFCHMPILGSFIEFHRHTLLSYSESLRSFIAQVSSEGEVERSLKAPMPCRVLRITKPTGSQVKKGEVVIVVESMKMEMNIMVNVEGKFECKVAVGDAVEEGSVLGSTV